MLTRFFIFTLLLILSLPLRVGAQEAIVLSGGGGRGLAHVGVFMGMEELGYDPDIVVGTSMGALMGALYAAGYDAGEIRERISGIDWNELFTPTPLLIGPERVVSYPLISFDLDLAQRRAARGFIAQWRINRALATLLFDANARARGDFDRLARRYRAVAADLETGDAVVLEEGDLARAARASMAVPGFFGPIAWGDQILVDGGIVDNVPTGVARRLGATRVIVSDVARPTDTIVSLAPLQVINRALDLMQDNTQRDPVPPDALVLPNLDPTLGAASFPADPEPLFQLGREAAHRDLPAAPRPVGRGERPLPSAPDSVYGLLIEAPDSALAALARRVFEGTVPGPYDPEAVIEAMDRLYASGLAEGVWPRVVENPDTGRAAPVLLVRVEAHSRTALAAAAGYENDRGGRAWLSLERYAALARRPAVLSVSASQNGIERFAAAAVRVYMLNPRALAWSVGAYLSDRDVREFTGDAVRNDDVLRAGGWLALELPYILRDRATTLSLRGERIESETGPDGLSVGPLLRYTANNPDVLIVGVPFLAEGELRFGEIGYSRLAVRGSRALELGPLTVAALGDFRDTHGDAPDDVYPALGDDHLIPGLRWGEMRGRGTVVAGLDVARPLATLFVKGGLRSGAAFAELRDLDLAEWVTGAQIAILWRNPIASLEWGFGLNTEGRKRFDINLGRRF